MWFGKYVSETLSWKLWMGNFCRSFGNWKEQRRLSTLPGLFNIPSTAQQHAPSAPPHPISNVASCRCASAKECQGTFLAPPHPTSPHGPSCWRASAKEPHPTSAHRTSMPCTTSRYTIAKIDNLFSAASQPITKKNTNSPTLKLSMNVWSMIF